MFSADDYGQALGFSFLFYEAQRSGVLPTTNRIPWRRNSALGDATARYDANNNGQLESNETLSRDLAGGYYDAGDRMKYAYPLASSLTLLSWGATQYQNAYEATGQLDEALDAIKWGTDWLLKAHETTGTGASLQTVRLWGQVGRTDTDHNNISDDQNIALPRPAYFIDASKPGSDLAAEAAAAFASASILFRATDSIYADQLLNHAKALYKFAYQYQGRYSNVITDTAYSSSNYNDDLAWGAVWLHKAIKSVNGNVNETLSWAGNQTYLQIAKNKNLGLGNWTQTWGDKEYGAAVLIAQEDPTYNKTAIENWLNYWTESGPGHIAYSPGGLAFLNQWGSLRLAANAAFLAAVYSDTVRDYNGRYADFAKSQIDYMLGKNPRNSSYLVGFGTNYSRNPHHANAHLNNNPAYNGSNGWTVFDSNTPNYNLLIGGLVGGPGSANDFDYQDNRLDYVRNEVALDYNAAFTGVLAYLYQNSPQIIIPTANLSAPQTVIEGQFQPQSAVYTVTLTEASSQTITLNYGVTNGTALAGLDYNAVSGSLTFAPGILSQTIVIPILNDNLKESKETFTLSLSNPYGVILGTSSVVTTLTDTLTSDITTVLPSGVENLTLSGNSAINGTGNAGPNTLIGNTGANILTGLAGNDIIDGKTGADTMIGGPGNDTYSVDNVGDIVTENFNEGTDSVKASLDYTLGANVEKLTLLGTTNLNGTGNELNNTLTGNTGNNILTGLGGNDRLDGKAGADTMIGGLGNDTYTVDNIEDIITENPNEGTDAVTASINYTLGANVENLTLSGSANISGTGNDLKNTLTGNTGANVLNGGAGADTLAGKAGADTFVFRFGESTITALDRISDFAIGSDKFDLLTQGGAAMNAPVAFTRAADSVTTNINTVTTNVFADADGALAGNQALGINSAALVKAGSATYLFVNDGVVGFQSANDLAINLTGITGTLPALGTISVSNFFV